MVRAYRFALLFALSLFTAGCQVIADIFQAGFVVGIIVVLLILGIIGFLVSRMRGR